MKSINLLPPKHKAVAQGGLLLPMLAVTLLLLLVAQGCYIWMWNSSIDTTAEQVVSLDNEMNEIRNSGVPLAVVDGYKQAERLSAELERQRIDWKPYTDIIVGELPAKTKIVTINAEGDNKLNVELDFGAYSEVIAYMKTLEHNDQLNNVLLTSFYKKTESEPVKKSVFKLLLTIDLGAGKGGAN
jgi:Tfp pilus assembly protein PilN